MNASSKEDRLTIPLEGRIDANTVSAIEGEVLATIKDNPHARPLFDAERLMYISSAGLRLLLKCCKLTGDRLEIINVRPEVYDIFEVTGFSQLLDIQKKIPDIERIEPIQMINGQMELAFYQTGFEQPFFSSRMSDGTLKLFAYYLMLHENTPRQLIFIEEPENGLYHHYLADLAYEMKKSTGTGYNKQIFVTTHSPFFVNALSPEQVWVLEKGADGFTTAKRASEYPFVKDMAEEGVSMGDLWYSKYFG